MAKDVLLKVLMNNDSWGYQDDNLYWRPFYEYHTKLLALKHAIKSAQNYGIRGIFREVKVCVIENNEITYEWIYGQDNFPKLFNDITKKVTAGNIIDICDGGYVHFEYYENRWYQESSNSEESIIHFKSIEVSGDLVLNNKLIKQHIHISDSHCKKITIDNCDIFALTLDNTTSYDINIINSTIDRLHIFNHKCNQISVINLNSTEINLFNCQIKMVEYIDVDADFLLTYRSKFENLKFITTSTDECLIEHTFAKFLSIRHSPINRLLIALAKAKQCNIEYSDITELVFEDSTLRKVVIDKTKIGTTRIRRSSLKTFTVTR